MPNSTLAHVYGSRSGRALGLVGDSLLIGAPISYDTASNLSFLGRAFEWVRVGSTWTQTTEIVANDTPQGRQFACAIGYDGVRAIFGASAEDDLPSGLSVGTAYVFRRAGGWVQEQELPRAGIDNADYFGLSVDLDGARAVVGAPNANSPAAAGSGVVRVFDFDGATWSEQAALDGAETVNGDKLGTAVALDGLSVIGGAPAATKPNYSTGEAYVWRLAPPATTVYCTAKTNSLGCVPTIATSGVASATSAAPFVVSTAQVLNQKLGLAFYGYAPAAAPFQGGWLCVQPPTRRLPTTNSGGSPSGSDCSGSHGYELNALIQSGSDPALVVGADMHVQFWTRDPGSPSTTGLSAGLRANIQP